MKDKKYLTELEQRRLLVENLTEIEFNELENLIEMHVDHVIEFRDEKTVSMGLLRHITPHDQNLGPDCWVSVVGTRFLKKIPWYNLTDCRCGPEILGPNVEQRLNKLIQKTGRLN